MSVLEAGPGSDPGRKKRTYKAADDRRDQILECALETFARKGYHAASIADVCAAAGVARGTLYQYFEDKLDLLRALADQLTTRITDALRARAPVVIPPGVKPSEQDAVAFIEARFRALLEVVFGDARAARLILRAGRGAGVLDDLFTRLDALLLKQMESELELAIAAGVVRPLDVPFVARFLLGGVEKSVLAHLDDERGLDTAKVAREVALLEVCGIYARAGVPAPRARASRPAPRKPGTGGRTR